jgi:hypothetical protein
MSFRYVGNDFFFLNFTAPAEDIAMWQDTAREIAYNVKVNYEKRTKPQPR